MAKQSPAAGTSHPGRSVKHSRNGCVACKARRRRCTEERPSCARCVADKRDCQYAFRLVWEDESRQRGIRHGRSAQDEIKFVDPTPAGSLNSSRKGSPCHIHFLNTFVSDLSRVDQSGGAATREGTLRCKMEQDKPAYSIHNGQTDSISASLYQYYESKVCYKLFLVADPTNGFRNIVLPFAQANHLVMDALLAVGALHISSEHPSDTIDYYAIALTHRQNALSRMRNEIAALKEAPSDHILVATLMLCLFDVTDNCHASWSTHLKAASDLMKMGNTAVRNPSLAGFVSRFFAKRGLLSRSACRVKSYTAGFSEQTDKTWGCSFELKMIITAITDLSRRKAKQPHHNDQSLQEQVASVEKRLCNLNQILPSLPAHNSSDVDVNVGETAALVQNAANIYFYTALRSALPDTSHIQLLVKAQIHLLSTITNIGSTHLWSIFVTSLYANDDEQRQFVMKQFERLEAATPTIEPAPTARSIVETVWKRRDLDADVNRAAGTGSGDVQSDWERFVRPLTEGHGLFEHEWQQCE